MPDTTPELLAALESAASGGLHRGFQLHLDDGTTMFVSFQNINFHARSPIPRAPSNTQIHETLSRLASAKPLS